MGRLKPTLRQVERAAQLDAEIAADEATQCQLCGDYQGAHLRLCPNHPRNTRTPMRYRVVYSLPPSTTAVEFVFAATAADAIAQVAIEHPAFTLVSCAAESDRLSVEQQRDELIAALRPLFTVCRALLDNPNAAPLFTAARRAQLEAACSEAVDAMKAAGVTS